jgi:mono/diheme cytochrome c family protein
MKRETLDLIGSGLLLLALATATIATLAPTPGAGVATSSGPSDPLVERGEMLFYAKGCATCHGIAGISQGVGAPDLTSIDTVAGSRRPGLSAEAYIRESLLVPGAFIAPGWGGTGVIAAMPDLGLSEAEVNALTAFLLAPDTE